LRLDAAQDKQNCPGLPISGDTSTGYTGKPQKKIAVTACRFLTTCGLR